MGTRPPEGGSHKDAMLSGDLYLSMEPPLVEERGRATELLRRFDLTSPADHAGRRAVLTELLGYYGEDAVIRGPFHCDYGYNLRFGARSFANFGFVVLDVCPVTVGDDVQIASHVQLLAATHPLEPGPRREGWELGAPITIGDGAWLGGGVIVLPGVSIGETSVIGAGSVVTRDIPAGVVAVGNPCRVVRDLP